MDCYRLIGDDKLGEMHCARDCEKTTNADGSLNSPMRNAEAQLTLAVVAARRGELAEALTYGEGALAVDRKSKPSLLMIASELDVAMRERYGQEAQVQEFHDRFTAVANQSA
jgi:hypothetical protein